MSSKIAYRLVVTSAGPRFASKYRTVLYRRYIFTDADGAATESDETEVAKSFTDTRWGARRWGRRRARADQRERATYSYEIVP